MMKTLFWAAAAAVALSTTGAAMAAGPTLSASGAKSGVRAVPAVSPSALTVLYDQTANDSGVGIVSQNFETAFDDYDSQAADDFTVPAGQTWSVREVDVTGVYFNGAGPAASQHVTFYANKKGKPGAVIADFPALMGKDNGFGSFVIKLPKGSVTLAEGTYWMSVQANLDFSVGGEWAWENQTTVEGAAARWVNKGDGFATGCTRYAVETNCISTSPGDHMFMLKGKIQ